MTVPATSVSCSNKKSRAPPHLVHEDRGCALIVLIVTLVNGIDSTVFRILQSSQMLIYNLSPPCQSAMDLLRVGIVTLVSSHETPLDSGPVTLFLDSLIRVDGRIFTTLPLYALYLEPIRLFENRGFHGAW